MQKKSSLNTGALFHPAALPEMRQTDPARFFSLSLSVNEARAELEPASGTDPPLPDAGDGADAHLGAVVHHRRHAGTRQALGAKFRQQECLFSHFLLPGTEAISRDDPAGPHPGSLRVTGTALPGRCRAQAQHSSALCPPPGSSASPRATPALRSTQSSPASDKGSGQQRGLCPPRAGRDTAQGHCTGTHSSPRQQHAAPGIQHPPPAPFPTAPGTSRFLGNGDLSTCNSQPELVTSAATFV